MGNRLLCPPRVNWDYVKSPNGICKASAVVIGVFCWGIVYIGDVMATSNEAPEINDQVLLYSGVTLPVWILTLILYILCSFASTDIIPFQFDAVLSAIFSVAYLACVIVGAVTWDFTWTCVISDDTQFADTGECLPPDEKVLRNSGQNLAAVVLSAVLVTVYAAAAALACFTAKHRKRNDKGGNPQGVPLSDGDGL